ncbi:MAG: SPASM domain-containing protein [Armatimonadetes bacterium]|nr:SPASM domain-containing protein [Armatimonadota bacterium]
MYNINIRFIKKSFRFKRFVNSIKVYLSYYLSLLLKKSIYWGFPPVVMIEPTNICNLKCPMCPSGNGTLKRAKGYMEFSTFKIIIDEIKNKSFMVVLWNQGEPFLNKDFLKMVKYASDKGLFTLVSTNANIDINVEETVKSGLDSIIVSLDGSTQATYNKYRVNGDFDKVLKNVRKLIKIKKKLNVKHPLIRWQFLVMKHNEHEIESIKKLANELGVESLEFKTVQIYSKDDIHNFLPENPKYQRYKIKGDDFELKFGVKNRCRRIWTNAVVNWDGEVAICCFDKDVEYKIGNIKDKPLAEIWKKDSIQKIRNQILSNRKKILICRNCGESVKLRIKQV